MASLEEKFVPGSDAVAYEIFKYPFTIDTTTIEFIKSHGRIMFIIRGLPGTGKNSLCDMLTNNYPSAKVCSADSYFTETFSSTRRDRESLKRSHEFCQKMVERACGKGVHPIIVKNTHVVKFEMQRYLDFAAEYNYTVIVASTVDRFETTPEILAKSNTKGLSVDYFRNRMKGWKDVTPTIMGWFLGLKQSSRLLRNLQTSLDYLLGDGKFCRIMDAYDSNELLKQYKVRKELYAITACGPNNSFMEIKSYSFSAKVKKNYGQCFTVEVQGFVVTPSYILAVVHLDTTMHELYHVKYSRTDTSTDEDLVHSFSSFTASLRVGNFEQHCKTVDFPELVDDHEPEETGDNELINVKKSCFMIVAEGATEQVKMVPFGLVNEVVQLLKDNAILNGDISSDKMRDFDDGYRFCRLSEQAWLLTPPETMLYQSIFTGIYV